MTCREWRARYHEWWTAPENATAQAWPPPAVLEEHPAGCPRCRRVHEALSASLRRSARREEAPAGLPDKIMDAIAHRSFVPDYRRLPLPALVLPGLAAAGLVIALFFFLPGGSPRKDSIAVRLLLEAPGARSVAVAGDWNSWNPEDGTLSDEDGDGVWEIRLQLSPQGEYRYQFIINGESWIPDPRAPLQVEDGFGGVNSVLDL